jgi:hypothetical protein
MLLSWWGWAQCTEGLPNASWRTKESKKAERRRNNKKGAWKFRFVVIGQLVRPLWLRGHVNIRRATSADVDPEQYIEASGRSELGLLARLKSLSGEPERDMLERWDKFSKGLTEVEKGSSNGESKLHLRRKVASRRAAGVEKLEMWVVRREKEVQKSAQVQGADTPASAASAAVKVRVMCC